MTLILAALVVFMITHIKVGLEGTNAKLLLAGYILLIAWAAFRIFNLVKEVLKKE